MFYISQIIDTCKSPRSFKDWFSLSPAIIIQHHTTPFTCLLEGLHGKYFCMSVSWLAGKVWGLQQCNLAMRPTRDPALIFDARTPANISQTHLKSSWGQRNAGLAALLIRACLDTTHFSNALSSFLAWVLCTDWHN